MNQNFSASRRNPSLDLLKGLAIFMVVMGHVITMCIREIDAAFIFKFIGNTHMPIFFFVSGYLSYKSGWQTPRLKKRFLQLMVPMLLIPMLWVWYFPHSGLQSPICHSLKDTWASVYKDGYWFTLCLFEQFVVNYLLCLVLRRLRRTWMQVAACVLTYAVLLLLFTGANVDANFDPFGLTLLSNFFPIFMMGVFARKHKDGFERIWQSGTWVTVSIVVFACTFYAVAYPWEMPYSESIHKPIITSIISPIMQAAWMVVAMSVVAPWASREFAAGHRPTAAARYFDLLGNESLGIYLLHYFFLFPLTPLQEPMRLLGLHTTPLLIVAIPVAFCIIGVTLIALQFIGKSPLLAWLLTGKIPARIEKRL